MIAFAAQLVNFALSLLIWLIIGRFALGLLIGDRPNFAMGLFQRGTDPVYRLVRRVTPSLVDDRFVPAISLVLLFVARLLLLPLLRLEG
jgi:uncharacterized protein YggT (Ycf19 family)